MNYKLPNSDIFSRNKVETLIFCIERVIIFCEDYIHTDTFILDSLKTKLYFLSSDIFWSRILTILVTKNS